MINKTILLLLSIWSTNSMAQIEIMENFEPGENNVGFRHEKIIDYSRANRDGYRTLPLFIWYPTKEKSINKMAYEQYFSIDNSIHPDTLIQQEITRLNQSGETAVKLSDYKALKTIAQPEAQVLEGKYPLILFAPGGNTKAQLHSIVCEYLASHGFIVASFPSLGNVDSLRWPFNQIGLNLHLDDMALIINHLNNTMEEVNIDKTGLIAWSVGGVSQGIYTMKNPNIDMFISLDSGLGRTYGIDMLKESPYFSYTNFRTPYFHITGKQPEKYQVERSSEFYDSIASVDKYSLVLDSFAHQHFAAQIGIIPEVAKQSKNKALIVAYKDMCQLTLLFSNIHLKGEKSEIMEWTEMIKDYTESN